MYKVHIYFTRFKQASINNLYDKNLDRLLLDNFGHWALGIGIIF